MKEIVVISGKGGTGKTSLTASFSCIEGRDVVVADCDVDAADMHEEAGTIKVLEAAKIKKADFKDQFSTHGMALLETLTLAEKLEMDCEITIVGVQPEFTGFNLELSEKISSKIPEVVDTVRSLIL